MGRNKLQVDYTKVQAKIEEASKALLEAIKLAKLSKGKSLLNISGEYNYDEEDGSDPDPIINFDSLLDAMDKAGWQTSSFGC